MPPRFLRRFTLIAVAVGGAVCAFVAPTAKAGAPPAPPADASALLEPLVTRFGIPGIAAVVLHGNQIAAEGFAGARKRDSEDKIGAHDRFHLGSDTKAMTATLVGLFVDEGKLSWSTTLGETFGPELPAMEAAWKPVTLRQILAHRAGLPPNPGTLRMLAMAADSSPLREQRRALVVRTLSDRPEHPPGGKYLYSNVGYILAGAILEKVSNQTWEDLMRERLFAPLEISSGGFGPPRDTATQRHPWGHAAGGGPRDPARAGADNPAIYGPAGTAHMTLRDWAKFIALHLRGHSSNPRRDVRLLRPETFAALHTPAPGETYVGGWGIATRRWAKGTRADDIGRVLTHSGSNTMWFCVAWLAPEIDFAVIVASNAGGDDAAKACDAAAGELIKKFGAGRTQ